MSLQLALAEAVRKAMSKRREAFDDGVDEGSNSLFIGYFVLWLIFFLVALGIAVYCKARPLEYFAVVLDPWVYILIRAVFPCSRG